MSADAPPKDEPVEPRRRGRPPKAETEARRLAEAALGEQAAPTEGEQATAPKARRGRTSKVDQVERIVFKAAHKGGKLLSVASGMIREPTATKLRFDAAVIGSPEGAMAIAKCARQLGERNAKLANAIIRMDENAGVAGAGTALLLTVLVPILINHEIISVPAEVAGMLGVSQNASPVAAEDEA